MGHGLRVLDIGVRVMMEKWFSGAIGVSEDKDVVKRVDDRVLSLY